MNRAWTNPLTVAVSLAAAVVPFSGVLADDGDLGGNRYYYERYYASEMSAAQAFLETVVKQGRWTDRSDKLVIIDVRDATEYSRGHPDGAYHVPYPRIYQLCTNDARSEDGGTCLQGGTTTASMPDDQFFLTVEAMFPDKSQRLALLCRTGSRSVRGGNILSAPEEFLGPEYAGRGYSRVFNIWQGFVGQPMAPIKGSSVVGPTNTVTTVTLDGGVTAFGFAPYQLDLNNDGLVNIEDNDGWRYHQGLPYSTRMLPKLLNDDAMPYYDLP
jgi:rhodanese-related sulfurtransferase